LLEQAKTSATRQVRQQLVFGGYLSAQAGLNGVVNSKPLTPCCKQGAGTTRGKYDSNQQPTPIFQKQKRVIADYQSCFLIFVSGK
jgi:hypothetical protein